MAETASKTNTSLWKRVVARVKAGDKGGKSGQWSARKAQLATLAYKKAGGGYRGAKSASNSLAKWTRQKWRTKSGKPSTQGSEATGERYLPEKAIKSLSSEEYAKTTAAKRAALKRGQQFSRQPSSVAKKVKPHRT